MADDAEKWPAVGVRVELSGLASRPELNGRIGVISSHDASNGRLGVKLGEKTMSIKPSSLTEVTVGPADSFECAICWADAPGEPTALPCCGSPPLGSSTCYCKRCLEVICEAALCGMGRCPTCREFIQVLNGELAVAAGLAQCAVCQQVRPAAEQLPNGQGALCGACAIGVRAPLRYECERCHDVQRVPHPMYRYQPAPAEFGNNPWFCQRCADFTNRRVLPEDAGRVPPDDAPEGWGRRDEWLKRIRARRVEERRLAEHAAHPAVARGTVAVIRELVATRWLELALLLGAVASWLWS